jgi:hypothetical protein
MNSKQLLEGFGVLISPGKQPRRNFEIMLSSYPQNRRERDDQAIEWLRKVLDAGARVECIPSAQNRGRRVRSDPHDCGKLMGYFRFRRSIRILPFLRLNIGKRGVSTSIGVRGAHITVGHGKVRETVGLPGTGLSYTHVDGAHTTAPAGQGEAQPAAVAQPLPTGNAVRGIFWLALIVVIAALFVRALMR